MLFNGICRNGDVHVIMVYQNLTFHRFVVTKKQHPKKMDQLFPPLPPVSTILECRAIDQLH